MMGEQFGKCDACGQVMYAGHFQDCKGPAMTSSGETRISTERLHELIAGWEQSRLALELDAHDSAFNYNCADTTKALRELAATRREYLLVPRNIDSGAAFEEWLAAAPRPQEGT